jgi:YHS domain-containing protein
MRLEFQNGIINSNDVFVVVTIQFAASTSCAQGDNEMKNKIAIGLGVVVILVGAFMVTNKVSPVGWGWWGDYNASSGTALSGYDPVAYFESEEPTIGNSDHEYDWGGVTWQFSSDENKELFSKNPEDFAPQFGGYCSFAVSKGFTADISPDAWHIEDGKLYVFADQDVRDTWVDELDDGSLERSTENWADR